MKNFIASTIFIILGVCQTTYQALPSTVKICHRNDPNISECIINSIKHLQPRLASGDLGPGLQIPPQEPLKIGDITFGDLQNFKIQLMNVTARGGSNFQIQKLRADMNALKMEANLFYPLLELTGRYKFNANFFQTPVMNEGELVIQMKNSVNKINIDMEKYKKNGKEYLRFHNVVLKIQSNKPSSVQIKGIFKNRALDDIAGTLIRENPIFSTENITPHFEKSLSESLTKIANTIVSTATYDEIFPL